MLRAALSPLRDKSFRPLAFGYSINELGNWFGEIALAVLVFDQTGSALAAAGLFLAMQFVPAFVSQVLVVEGEKRGTRRALPVLYLLEAVIFTALAIVASHFSLALVLVLAAIDGSLAIAAKSLVRAASASALEPKGTLREGNAILNLAFTGSTVIGPALGGIVVAGLGLQTALFLDAGSFLLVALVLAVASAVPDLRSRPAPWLNQLRGGLHYVSANRALRRMLVINAALFLFLSAAVPVEIVYAKESLGAGDAGYGLLLGAWGVGMFLGSLVFAAARFISLPVLLLGSATTVAIGYLALALAPTIGLAIVASAFGGVGNGVLWVSTVSAIQGATPKDFQARIMGLLESSSALVPGVGFPIGGLIAQSMSPRVALAVSGVGALVVIGIAIPLLRRVRWAAQPDQATSEEQEAAMALTAVSS